MSNENPVLSHLLLHSCMPGLHSMPSVAVFILAQTLGYDLTVRAALRHGPGVANGVEMNGKLLLEERP